ncbi:MAG: outer membrane protein transport protein [Kiritimatiellae bacterium]|nr:outer membrane protein transport protein [Kiritimatiellia bacterium]MDD4736215.1 outer membrane protein transport protein [Kiritimatiellia bacterium]
MNECKRVVGVVLVSMGFFFIANGEVFAAGLSLSEYGGKGLGEAYAGSSASTEDATCAFFNPAGLSLMEDSSAVVGATYLLTKFSFTPRACTYPEHNDMPLTGGNGGMAGGEAILPFAYYSQKLDSETSVGMAVNTPFGLSSDYQDGWVGRYQALYSELQTVNFNPSISHLLTKSIAVGAGLNLQYTRAEFSSAVDFGSILAGQGVSGVMPQMLDGKATIKGDDWGWGYNAGIMLQPFESSTVGLTYRSEISYTLEGDATFDVPEQAMPLQAAGLFSDSDVRCDITMPESVSLGIAQKLSSNLTLKSEITWTRWSRFQELRIQYDSNQPDSVTEENWNDAFRYALGLNYAVGSKWIIRIGTAYDESPVPNAEHRTPNIPDSNRIWLSAGASCRMTERVGVDLAYTRLYFNQAEADTTGPTGDRLQGYYDDAHFDSIALQISYLF